MSTIRLHSAATATPPMAAISFFFLLLLLHHFHSPLPLAADTVPSPYLSPTTFHRNHHRMLQELKIFAYQPHQNATTSTAASLFNAALFQSRFLTADPNQAHLFYLPFPTTEAAPRSIARSIRALRSDLPFWNHTLGADHFYLAENGIGIQSDRNLVELRKNSIQISPFPTAPDRFIPHKDVTLPPPLLHKPYFSEPVSFKYLAFYNGVESPEFTPVLDDLRGDPEFFIESSKDLGAAERAEVMSASRFCLYFYGLPADTIGEALGSGCVPVVVSGRPVLDLPFGDVLRWSEMAVFVGLGGGAKEMRMAIRSACGERYLRMRKMAVEASVHFSWSSAVAEVEDVEPYDAFHSVMYQLWLRRHTIRYARRGWSEERF